MTSLILHFKRPQTWSRALRIHVWNTAPATLASEWPGQPLEDDGDDWFSIELSGVTRTELVVHDGQGHQTPDLAREREGWFEGGQ